MATFVQDLRFGFRLLVRQRGFTAIAALVLALGIGANTAVFSLVNALVLKPRPGAPDAELAGVYSRDRTQADEYRGFSYPNYADLRGQTDLFRSLAAHTFSLVGPRRGRSDSPRLRGHRDAPIFSTPSACRCFTGGRSLPTRSVPAPTSRSTILSYGAWQRMGGRTDLVGSRSASTAGSSR